MIEALLAHIRRLLAKGPKAGAKELQSDGKPVANMANLGLARGGKATGTVSTLMHS